MPEAGRVPTGSAAAASVPLMRAATIGVAYFITAYAGLHFTRFGAPIESVWLANVIVVWAMTTAPRRDWGYFIAAAALGHIGAHTLAGDNFLLTAPALVADMAESLLVTHLICIRPNLFAMRTRSDVWYYLCVSIGASIFSAIIAWAGKLATPYPMTLYDMGIWIAADALALNVFLPILKGLENDRWRSLFLGAKRVRAALLMLGVVAVSIIGGFTPNIPGVRLVLIPLLVVVAFDLGVAGSQAGLALMTVTWLLLAINGHSPAPWIVAGPREHVVNVQYFAALISAAVLPLAVTLEQKQRLTDSLAETLAETRAAWGAIIAADARYRLVVDYATEMVMRVAPDGEILFASRPCDDLSPDGRLTGTNLFALMQAQDGHVAKAALEGVLTAALYDLAQHWTYRLRHADGDWRTYDARATLIAPGGKKAAGEFVFVLRAAS